MTAKAIAYCAARHLRVLAEEEEAEGEGDEDGEADGGEGEVTEVADGVVGDRAYGDGLMPALLEK